MRLINHAEMNFERTLSPVSGRIGVSEFHEAILITRSNGECSIKGNFTQDIINLEKGKELYVEIYHQHEPIISGRWYVDALLPEEIKLTHILQPLVKDLSPYFDHLTFFRDDLFKVFSLLNPEDQKVVSSLFTEIKDHPEPLEATIYHHSGVYKAHFNFEASSKNLEEIHFSISNLNTSWDGVITVRFHFLALNYVLTTTAIHYEKEFNLLRVKLPEVITTCLSRKHSRVPCHKKVKLLNSNHSVILNNISPRGCEIIGEFDLMNLGATISFQIDEKDKIYSGTVVGSGKNRINLLFTDDMNTRQSIYFTAIEGPITIRKPENYHHFLDLYQRVGYSEKVGDYDQDPYPQSEWAQRTQEIWSIQDSRFLGNTIGERNPRDEVVSSCSYIPFTRTIGYSHSVAMDKSIESLAGLREVLSVNVSSLDFQEHAEYFLGSGSVASTFTTKLLTVFKASPLPKRNATFESLRIGFGKENPENLKGETYTMTKVNPTEISVAEDFNFMFKHSVDVPDLWKDLAHIQHFQITESSGEIIAFIMGIKGPEFMTAANFFRICWCITLKDQIDFDTLYRTIHQNPFLKPLQINFFSKKSDFKDIKIKTNRKQDHILWFWIHRDETGLVMNSIHRAIYGALKKYGDQGRYLLARMAS